jgi:hypothetical protein
MKFGLAVLCLTTLLCGCADPRCVGDCVNGQGTATFADGGKYVGEWRDDKMNGQGTATFADGKVVSGRWEDGEPVSKEEAQAASSIGGGQSPQNSHAQSPAASLHVPPQIPHVSPPAHGPGVQTPLRQVSGRVHAVASQLAAPSGLKLQSDAQHDRGVPLAVSSSHSSVPSRRPLPHSGSSSTSAKTRRWSEAVALVAEGSAAPYFGKPPAKPSSLES